MAALNPSIIIAKKRDGGTLTKDELASFVAGYVSGEITDYQMAAMAMAIFLRGLDSLETTTLTELILNSGAVLEWSNHDIPIVDKHSTGGIGDKVSIILAPLLACCGLQVPMISGRGLGATGGTLDKLESISDFRTDLSILELQQQTEQLGCVITGATPELVPADRKLYALRDATGTVPSIPLITASIMSKKLAESLDALVLDVKFGSGAFMKTIEEARELAQSMVAVGHQMKVRTSALLTNMNQPLGRMIGNAVEVNESIDCLQANGPPDLTDLVVKLSAELLVLTGKHENASTACEELTEHLTSGRAMERFEQMVVAQGGTLAATRRIAPAVELRGVSTGYVTAIDAEKLGLAIIELGGGRKQISDTIDHAIGIEMLVRLGDEVEKGEPLVRVFGSSPAVEQVQSLILEAFTIEELQVEPEPLIYERISSSKEQAK